MGFEQQLTRLFGMSKKTWERHANPWSVWTRYLTPPFIVAAIWSRFYIGYWCLIPLGLFLLWTWINPRCFPKPKSTKSWASRGVLGERIWLNRKTIPLPPCHRYMPNSLAIAGGLSVFPVIYGLYVFDLQATIWGLGLMYVIKSWFFDRMVWIFEDMKNHQAYQAWEY